MSDSWILIALTILVVLLLFYLSKKMICNSYSSGGADGDDSPTTSSPSSSTTSTSFSDYLYGGYEGRTPVDLMDAAAITTSNGTSTESDDLAIDIADSLNYPSDHHYQSHHYRSDSQCPSNNNGNYNHSRNNLDLSNSVSSNGRRMSCDGGGGRGGGVPAIIDSRIIDSNNGMDFGGSPLPPTLSSSAATTGSQQQAILSPISIIAGPALERKTMLEIQLRNQIAKIVQAEREIQRLVQLLSLEQQRQGGLDIASNNMLAAARASLLQHHQRYPQLYRHLRGIQYSPSARLTTTTTITSPSEPEGSTTTDATVVAASTHTPCNNSILKNSNIPSLSGENVFTTNIAVAHGSNDHHRNPTTTETTLPENHRQQQHICHSHHIPHQHRNENLLVNSNPIENSAAPPTAEHLQQNLILSCGLNANSIVNFHHHHNQQQQQRYCACNLCFNGTGTRRMLMLRRMLLPLPMPTFPIDTNANPTEVEMEPGAAASRGDFLTRSLEPLAHDLYYPREEQRQQQHQHRRHIQQPVPAAEPQSGSGFSDYSHQHHPHNYYHHPPDDDPPPYEECIRSSAATNRNTSYCDEGQNQDLYNNNYSNSPSSRNGNTASNNRENRVEQTPERISVLA